MTSDTSVFFLNKQYPNADYEMGSCTLTILHTPSICQLRLDLQEFELSEPNSQGLCDSDFFKVDGFHVHAPTICGRNTLQHSKASHSYNSLNLCTTNHAPFVYEV